jgi:hypothetical protein
MLEKVFPAGQDAELAWKQVMQALAARRRIDAGARLSAP